ncbi:hypothetical protein D9M68_606510 [compost metagenome]
MADFAVHGLGVFGRRQLALLERLPCQADRCGLRKRTDGGGRQRRQLQALTLFFDALDERRNTLAIGWGNGIQAQLHSRLVDAWRIGATGLYGAALDQGDEHVGSLRPIHGTG